MSGAGAVTAGDAHGAATDAGAAPAAGAGAVGAPTTAGAADDRVSQEDWDAIVVGGGIAGLSAAWELTLAGLHPLLVEARGYTGGLVAGGRVAGARVDLGAEGFVLRGEEASSMVDALSLEVVGPSGGGARLFLSPAPGCPVSADDPAAGWSLHRFVRDSFLGIPAHPTAEDVVAVVGREAAERAARDADLPGEVGTSPEDPGDLASFITARMGSGVLERLVRPIVAGIHSAEPSQLAADTVAPGLREATARLGSLQAAIAERLEQRAARRRAGRAADVTPVGGLVTLTDALRDAVESAGGSVLTRTGAQSLRPGATPGTWELTIAPTTRGATPSAEPVPDGPERVVRTGRLVLACSAAACLRLLDGVPAVATDVEVPVGSPIARMTLVVRAPGLDGAPVGSGLLVAPAPEGTDCPVRAKALSHLSVKWPWVGEELAALHGPGVHALRLSYGRPGEPRPDVSVTDALRDAALLTGAELSEGDVLDHLLVRWDGTLPPITPAHRARTARLLGEADGVAGLAVTGAWVAGTGVAAVVEHARRSARSLARAGEEDR